MFKKHQADLITKCKANDRSAQERLYKQFYEEMFRICCRYLKSEDLAKDAFNTAFLKVFKNIGDFDEKKGELGGWIRTVVVRTCIDLKRKELRFATETLIDEIQEVFIPPEILSKLYAEDLLTYVRNLPQATQVIFNLSVIDGYSHQEIAEQLDISEVTSRWHLSEAKKKLRAIILYSDQHLKDQSTTPKFRKS